MLKNIDFNKNSQRWKNYFCLFISFLFLIFFYVNRTTILENDPEFSSKFKIASIVLGWIVGVVLIFVRLDFGKKWNRVINILYILFAPCYIFFNMEIAVFNETYSFRGQHLSLLLFNFLLIGILELIFIVITNRVRLGTDIWAFICIMFNIVNHFVYEFRGTPAMASDIATVGTALEVADGYKIQFNFYTTVALVMLFDFIMLGRVIKCEPVFKKVSHRLCGIAVMAIVSVTGFSQLVMTDMVSNRGLYLSLFNPMRSYQQYGSIACFTRSIKLSVPEKPNGYSLKKVEEITSKYTSDTVDPNKKRPNVIAVINEAFSDPQILGDIETNEDYMPFIHDLMKNGNCVSGTTYASIVGGQTANTEYEFLTGNSMAFLPKGTVAFQLYLRHAMPSLVTELKSEGYTGNSATHLQKARNYNRDKAYPLLGFDKFYDYTNMIVPFVKMRNNATDQCTYDNITHDYEQQRKSTDAPYFGYTMTIQNHSSYDVPFDNFDDKRIVVENADATDLGYYLSLIKYSDEMFENLINYYKNTDEPTVIFLTGDHQPRIHDESMDSITNGEWRNWNDEEMMRRYEVPFLIWANYDIDKKTVEKTSMNYLQTILMETIDGDLTGFQKFQQDLQKEEITSKYTSDTVDPNKKRPNVIAVINEAFSDPQILGDIETNEDYMPFIHDLMKNGNCVSGTTYASIVGGQTANTEYEFLTGNSMAFLPKGTVAFQLYLRHAMPSLVTELKSEGYTGNSATHLQKARNYNRDKAYPLLGFDKFYDYTNMIVPFVKMRNNATDQCTYDNITHDYEQQRKSTDAPYFGYTMTIQNHSSYDVPFDNFDDKRIVVENADATDLGYYLSLIKYSDEMFENLINYYKNTDEPTVIFLTGDHQPRIHDESMDSITNGEWRNWNDEEMMRRYEVPFLIWANYDIDKKTVEKTSMNYLQTILMETIDGDLTGFQKFQQDLQKEIPVLTSNGYWGADGKFYSVDDKNSPYYDLIQEYAMLQYNDMTDYKNRVEDFFELKQ